jgi:glutathionylspermidine synthase
MALTEVEAWLRSRPLEGLSAAFQAEIFERGLYVWRDGAPVPIPALLTPVARDRAFEDFSVGAADLLARAQASVAEPAGTELERSAFQAGRELVTARVDGLATSAGIRAIEINATIPAMQGYGDIISHAWIRHIGAARGHGPQAIATFLARCGSHATELLSSLIAAFHRAHPEGPERPSVAIVARHGDSQIGELRYLRERWQEAGHRVDLVDVDRLAVDQNGIPSHQGERFDLVYRHIFGWRVDPVLPFARLLRDPGGRMFNPVSAPLESKALLAGISSPIVPWTARLVPGATTPSGGDLAAWAADHPEEAVLKRAEGYGGVGVFLGVEHRDAWRERIAKALGEGGFIIQEYVPQSPEDHLVVRGGSVASERLYLDRSAFTSTLGPRPTGGVVRASRSRIVNILGGGGLAPFIPADVLAEL